MSKKQFNYTILCLIALLTFLTNISSINALSRNFTNYYGLEINEEEYTNLENLGFTPDEIYYMTEDIFKANKDIEATLVSRTKKYFKTVYPTYGNSYSVEVTADEYYSHDDNNLRGIVQTAWRTEESTISATSLGYRYKMVTSWDMIPPDKYYDVIGIGFDDSVHIYANTIFYYNYDISSGSHYTSFNYYDINLTATGASFSYQLPSSFVGLTTTMFYDVQKDDPNSTITSLYICGDYAHAITSVSGAQADSHSINVGGIFFNPMVIYSFDEVPCCDAYASVNW